MSTSEMNPTVDFYFEKADKWRDEIERLRKIVLACGLVEELKWGCPCYTFQGRNIVLIHVFKDYCALLFFKGALLNDPEGLLIRQTENVQSARQIRFTDAKQVAKSANTVKSYIYEAIMVEKAGLKVQYKKAADFKLPDEFQKKLKEMPALRTAFDALTPGRQRAYIFYFSQAKQSKTRQARVENYINQILAGKGIDD